MKNLGVFFLGAILIFTQLAGCVAYVPRSDPYTAYAPGPPPEPMVEIRPLIPFPEAVWLAGYWAFLAENWVWNNGSWRDRPHPGATWYPGHWHKAGPRGWGWRSGYWR